MHPSSSLGESISCTPPDMSLKHPEMPRTNGLSIGFLEDASAPVAQLNVPIGNIRRPHSASRSFAWRLQPLSVSASNPLDPEFYARQLLSGDPGCDVSRRCFGRQPRISAWWRGGLIGIRATVIRPRCLSPKYVINLSTYVASSIAIIWAAEKHWRVVRRLDQEEHYRG